MQKLIIFLILGPLSAMAQGFLPSFPSHKSDKAVFKHLVLGSGEINSKEAILYNISKCEPIDEDGVANQAYRGKWKEVDGGWLCTDTPVKNNGFGKPSYCAANFETKFTILVNNTYSVLNVGRGQDSVRVGEFFSKNNCQEKAKEYFNGAALRWFGLLEKVQTGEFSWVSTAPLLCAKLIFHATYDPLTKIIASSEFKNMPAACP
jgi:hypothetical protein